MNSFTFNPPYHVSGEHGKAFGSGRRTLAASWIEAADVSFKSMDSDELTWYQTNGNAPDYLESISLWDATGKRVFTGTVTEVAPTWLPSGKIAHHVTVAGPWWWLEQAVLSAEAVDSTGMQTERPEWIFPPQELAQSIRSILGWAADRGISLQAGEIAQTFKVPQMVFQQMDVSSALRTMLAWLYDGMTNVQYDLGTPRLNVWRRATAPVVTWHVGSDNCPLASEPIRIAPLRHMRPTTVRVQSATVDADGKIIYAEDVAGDPEDTSIIGRQMIAISGPGKVGFSEVDIRRAVVKTTIYTSPAFYVHNSQLAALKEEVGGEVYQPMTSYANIWVPSANGWTQTYMPQRFYWVINGVSTASKPSAVPEYLVIGDGLPDWWSATRINAVKVKLIQRFTCAISSGDPIQGRVASLAFASVESGGMTYYFADFEAEMMAVALDANAAGGVVVVHPDDAALVQPTGGLAAALFDAQNWVPYDGTVSIRSGAEVPLPGCVVNIRGAAPEWSAMRALVSAASIDLVTGRANVTLGSPPRESKTSTADTFQKPTSSRVLRL